MKDRLYVIEGGLSDRGLPTVSPSRKTKSAEPDLDVLKRSPCLRCELFARGRVCPQVDECGKIEAYQRVASAYRSLYRPTDFRSMG